MHQTARAPHLIGWRHCTCSPRLIRRTDNVDDKTRARPQPHEGGSIAQYGGSEQLKYEEVPLPQVAPGQVLAKVHYASVNPSTGKSAKAST